MNSSRVRRCPVTRDEYLRGVVTPSFVRQVIKGVVDKVITTNDFRALEEFTEFLDRQLRTDSASQIETVIMVRVLTAFTVDESNGRMHSFIPLAIDIMLERGSVSACVPLRGFVVLYGQSQIVEWDKADVKIQLPTKKFFNFSVHDRLWHIEVREIVDDYRDDRPTTRRR